MPGKSTAFIPKSSTALKRRIAPSVPLKLEITEGDVITPINFRVAFDMNAGVAIQEKSGFNINDVGMWAHSHEPIFLRAVLWGAVLLYQPEYDTVDGQGHPTDDGLEVIGSYIDDGNRDQIVEALWKAILNFLSKDKREMFESFLAAEIRKRNGDPADPAAGGEPPLDLKTEMKPESSDTSNSGPSPVTISDLPKASSAS